MVLTLQREKFKVMLEEAITLLCRSSLPYKCEASIEALIGITIDCDDVFLISIKEKFDNKLPDVSSDLSPEDGLMGENSLSENECEEVSVEQQGNDSTVNEDCSTSEPKSKKRKRDIDKSTANKEEFQAEDAGRETGRFNNKSEPTDSRNATFIRPSQQQNESNLSNIICGDITEIKSEQLYENFFSNCFSIPDELQRLRFNVAVPSYYNSPINVRVQKFPMPKETCDTKPPNLTALQIAMANEILNISGGFVNIGSAKAFQHNLRALSKSELSEVVNNMSLAPSNPYSVGVLCTEGVSRIFYKIPPMLIKQEALGFFNLDFYSYNNLYHSSIRVPHNIRDPEEWKALVAMKNPFTISAEDSSRTT